jgi:hypothetical protein
MAATRAYLDYNASAPLIAEARAAMVAALDAANPSSVHTEGRASRRLVEDARRDVARLVNARAEHVVFTSGATEAASTLLGPDWQMGRGSIRMSHLYVSAADHPCILNGGRFTPAQVTKIGVDRNGIADLDALSAALAAHDKTAGLPLVAIHAANNETGVVQPVGRIGEIVKAAGGVLVVDAVQAAARYVSSLCRLSDPVLAQDRWPEGRRRDRRRIRPDDAAAFGQWRRPRERPSRRHGKRRRDRRFRRRRAGCPGRPGRCRCRFAAPRRDRSHRDRTGAGRGNLRKWR